MKLSPEAYNYLLLSGRSPDLFNSGFLPIKTFTVLTVEFDMATAYWTHSCGDSSWFTQDSLSSPGIKDL